MIERKWLIRKKWMLQDSDPLQHQTTNKLNLRAKRCNAKQGQILIIHRSNPVKEVVSDSLPCQKGIFWEIRVDRATRHLTQEVHKVTCLIWALLLIKATLLKAASKRVTVRIGLQARLRPRRVKLNQALATVIRRSWSLVMTFSLSTLRVWWKCLAPIKFARKSSLVSNNKRLRSLSLTTSGTLKTKVERIQNQTVRSHSLSRQGRLKRASRTDWTKCLKGGVDC